jgi:hypothetical protein
MEHIMVRKKQTGRTSKTSETDAIDQAVKSDADSRQSIESRRFTPKSFQSRRKRRKAEKKIARTKSAGSFTILGRAILVLRNHWEIFGGLFVLFAAINALLTAGSLLRIDLASAKLGLEATGDIGDLGTGLALYGTLVSTGAVAGGAAGAYQMVIVVIISLAIVWALRQLSAGSKIRIRDTLFNSSYPLVQVLIVMVVAFLQLLPALVASYLVYNLLGLGVITVGWQQAIVVAICLLLVLWTAYMITASIFALYIATLPGMGPIKALRAARDIVQYRRAMVFRKLLFLPIILFVGYAVILVPLSLFLPTVATYVFFGLSMASLPIAHAYIYSLYRELIT